MKTEGFYIDMCGEVRHTSTLSEGMHFVIDSAGTCTSALHVVTETGEVFEEYVLWDSLTDLAAAGVEITPEEYTSWAFKKE